MELATCTTAWILLVTTPRPIWRRGIDIVRAISECWKPGTWEDVLSRNTPINYRQIACRGWIGPTREQSLALAIPELFPENEAGLVPDISVSGLSARTWSQPFPRDYLNHTFASSFTFQRETHTWKAGVLIAVEHSDSNLSQMQTQGSFTFGAGGGFSAFQNFLRGNPQGACGDACRYTETDIDAVNRFRFGRYEAFVQDSWRIRSNLTLDLGLRYAFYPPLKDANDMLFTFSPDAYDPTKAPQFADEEGVYLVVGSGDFLNGYRIAGQNSPYGRSIYAADTNNLQPRLGAAWSPGGSDRTIMRAGYGMYFDQTQVGMFTQNVQETFTAVRSFSLRRFR